MNAYDFDKTIFDGDSTACFYVWCLFRTPKMLLRVPKLIYGAIFVLRKDKKRFKQEMFSFLRDLKDPDEMVERFWNGHMRRVKRYYLSQKREDDIILSASPDFLVRPAMERLGVKRVIASPVDIRTGVYGGANCHGKEKVARLNREYPNAKIDAFYSDSHADDPMAAIAARAFLVRGEKLLPWR